MTLLATIAIALSALLLVWFGRQAERMERREEAARDAYMMNRLLAQARLVLMAEQEKP